MLFLVNQLPNFTGAGSITIAPAESKLVLDALKSGFVSLITDKVTADVTSQMLGIDIGLKTVEVSPKLGEDTVLFINLVGGQLPAGTTTLPPTHSLQFSVIETKKPILNIKAMKKGLGNWLLSN